MATRKLKTLVREARPKYTTLTEEENSVLNTALNILANVIVKGDALTDPTMAGKYMTVRLSNQPSEVFAVLFLDIRHRAIAYEELFYGTIDGAEVHPREVVRRALHHNAAAVILGHNHPSGDTEPSAADRAVTARIKQALGLVDVRLLDHFVVGAGRYTAFAARGWI